jgi:hypothetical protein
VQADVARLRLTVSRRRSPFDRARDGHGRDRISRLRCPNRVGSRPDAADSVADGPVNVLSDQVGVTVVAGVFLNHVLVDPAQRGRLLSLRPVVSNPVLHLNDVVQVAAGGGCARSIHAPGVVREVALDVLDRRLSALLVSEYLALHVRLAVEIVEPRLHAGEMTYQPHQAESGRRAGCHDELLWR